MFSAILLGLAFLSLAVMLSVFAADRTRASGLAIGTWFFFVLVFDLLHPRHAGRHRRRLRRRGVPYLLLLNPADVFRVLNVFTLDEVRTLYGLATVFPEALSNPTILGGVMLAWIVGPLAVAIWRFER
jgi:Cu-processing system permease protein